MISKEEFNRKIRDIVEKDKKNSKYLKYLSKEYQSQQAKYAIFGCIGLIVSIPVMAFVNLILGIIILAPSLVFMALSTDGFMMVTKANNYYKNKYSDKVIALLFNDHKYSFSSIGYIRRSIFLQSEFVDVFSKCWGKNLLTVNIPNDDNSESNNNLVLCDLDVIEIIKDKENTYEEKVFEGIFGYVDFPFEFKCKLFINSFSHNTEYKLKTIELEDIKFNNKFKVYSDDQIEARYILTPDMMEKLLLLKEKSGGFKITIKEDKLYIAFPYLKLFEIKYIKDGDVESMFSKYYDAIEIVMSLVEEIKSNNKVFKI